MRRTWIAIIVLGVAGCGASGPSLPPAPCNPLGAGQHCLSPWPSSAFEVDDATTATGVRLAIPDLALPTNQDGSSADPAPWNAADGFSPAAPIIVAFPGGVSADGLPPNDNYDGSITAASPTVLLDLTTGERVPHFAEIDMQATGLPDSQALFIRPAARLVGGHRYAVAITKLVKAADGGDLPISRGLPAARRRQLDRPSALQEPARSLRHAEVRPRRRRLRRRRPRARVGLHRRVRRVPARRHAGRARSHGGRARRATRSRSRSARTRRSATAARSSAASPARSTRRCSSATAARRTTASSSCAAPTACPRCRASTRSRSPRSSRRARTPRRRRCRW